VSQNIHIVTIAGNSRHFQSLRRLANWPRALAIRLAHFFGGPALLGAEFGEEGDIDPVAPW
jgi:hypothetical protein